MWRFSYNFLKKHSKYSKNSTTAIIIVVCFFVIDTKGQAQGEIVQ